MDELFAHPQARAALAQARGATGETLRAGKAHEGDGRAAESGQSGRQAFSIAEPKRQSVPLVFASPHSGRDYPADFVARSRLDPAGLRRSEDCFVDQLYSFAPRLTGAESGAPLLCALFPRAYVDPNREPYELDPAMFEESLPEYVNTRSPRVAAGLGTVARVVAGGAEIYRGKLTFEEVRRRIELTYWPYHEALRGLLQQTRESFGGCLLLDCHSMPSGVAATVASNEMGKRNSGMPASGASGPAFVLGDCHGSACDRRIVEAAESFLKGAGYRVARNQPYAGGFITRHYGRPGEAIHALQIEINRALYMNERRLEPNDGFKALQDDLKALSANLAEVCGSLFSK
ncbi:MAG: N-formylglutamate amidohydrolase [Limibacillus sp.]